MAVALVLESFLHKGNECSTMKERNVDFLQDFLSWNMHLGSDATNHNHRHNVVFFA